MDATNAKLCSGLRSGNSKSEFSGCDFLVTGASGFIGRELVRRFSERGHSGVCVSRSRITDVPNCWKWEERENVLKRSIPCEAVIHLEVKQHVQMPNADDISAFQEVNVRGTERWLDWAAGNNVRRFVFFSSIKAAGDSAECQDESSVSLPETPYGQSKLAAEQKVREWAAASPERSALILRPAVVYGPGNQANMFSLVDAIYRWRFFLVGRNDNIKSLISIRNLVAAVVHLLEVPGSGTQTFYLTDEASYSVAQIAEMIRGLLGQARSLRSLPLGVAKAAARVGDAFTGLTEKGFPLNSNRLKALLESTHFSCARLKATGFTHPQSTREGLAEMVNWYLSRYGKPS